MLVRIVPPRINSGITSGRGAPGPFGSGYRSPGNRAFVFTASVEMGDLPTLPERLSKELQERLLFHLEDAAQRVIDTARHYLVRLEESPVKINAEGKGIHGYDTGLMYVSLRYQLAAHLLATGVWYDLLSDDAKYWRWVEFGHWYKTAAGWQFWAGYHFLETAIEANAGYIRQRVREAWEDTAIALALEAHVPGAVGRLGFTGGH